MRMKDEIKQKALINATIETVNESGLAASSVSKIAKKAGISPATLYIYYKDKDDLLSSIYLDVKKNIGLHLFNGTDMEMPLKEFLHGLWKNMFRYIRENPEEFMFVEQFSASPCSEVVDKSEIEKHYEPIIKSIEKGITEGIIKDVSIDLINLFLFTPLVALSKNMLKEDHVIAEKITDQAFELAWDAIKR